MKSRTAFFLILGLLQFFSFQQSHAQFSRIGFWGNKKWSFSFSTSAQTVLSQLCSGVVTVQTKNPSGAVTNVSSNLTVTLSAPAGVTYYSDSLCTTPIASLTIASGTSSGSFYFIASTTGSNTITASATGYTSALQTETINTNGFIWTGGGGNANWSTAGNWSGGSAPGASNIAVFDSTCASNCSATINANVNVAGVRMASGYTGTITQSSGFTITTNGSGWVQLAGNFVGSSTGDAIDIKTQMAVTGGSFKSTSGNLKISTYSGAYDYVSYKMAGTFDANSGTLIFDPGCTFSSATFGTGTYNNITIQNSPNCADMTITDTDVTVAGNMSVIGPSTYSAVMRGGTFHIGGNLSTSGAIHWYGDTVFKLTGNASGQTITSTSNGGLTSLTIAAGANPVTLTGNLHIRNHYVVSSVGTFTSTGSTLTLIGGCSNQTLTPGTVTYNNVSFTSSCTTFNMGGGTMTVAGNLSFANPGYNGTINSGTFNVGGDVSATGPVPWGGSAVVKLTGKAGGQTIASTSSGGVPNLELATGANPVTITGTLLMAEYKVTSVGTLTTTGSTLNPRGGALTVGSESYNDFILGGACWAQTLTGTLKVNGNLTFNDSCNGSISGGAIQVKGNVNMSAWSAGGTTNITLNGTSQQSLSYSSGIVPGATFTVNNAAGVLLTSNVSMAWPTVSITAGSIDMNGKNLTIPALSLNGNSITRNSGALTVGGSVVPAGSQSLYGGTINP